MDEDLKKYLEGMETRLREHVSHECEGVETKLLSAFHGWARTMEIRVRQLPAFDERLALAEERIAELERRRAS